MVRLVVTHEVDVDPTLEDPEELADLITDKGALLPEPTILQAEWE